MSGRFFDISFLRQFSPALATVALLTPFLAAAEESARTPMWMQDDLLVRFRVAVVHPDNDSTVTPIGGRTQVSTTVMPEVDLSYFLTDSISIEAIFGIVPHKVKLKDTRLGDRDAGHVIAIAPTLIVQYHYEILPGVAPYLGAGMSYVHYIDDNDDGPVDYTDDVAPVLQGGVDVAIDEHWIANMDLKKAWVTTSSSSQGGRIRTQTNVDPWVASLGVGYKF